MRKTCTMQSYLLIINWFETNKKTPFMKKLRADGSQEMPVVFRCIFFILQFAV